MEQGTFEHINVFFRERNSRLCERSRTDSLCRKVNMMEGHGRLLGGNKEMTEDHGSGPCLAAAFILLHRSHPVSPIDSGFEAWNSRARVISYETETAGRGTKGNQQVVMYVREARKLKWKKGTN